MMKMLRILSLICVISSFEVSNKEETTKKVYLQNNDLGIYKKFVVASDVSYISEGTFNRLSVSGNFNKLPFANTFAVINGTAWKYSIYYAKKVREYVIVMLQRIHFIMRMIRTTFLLTWSYHILI